MSAQITSSSTEKSKVEQVVEAVHQEEQPEEAESEEDQSFSKEQV